MPLIYCANTGRGWLPMNALAADIGICRYLNVKRHLPNAYSAKTAKDSARVFIALRRTPKDGLR